LNVGAFIIDSISALYVPDLMAATFSLFLLLHAIKKKYPHSRCWEIEEFFVNFQSFLIASDEIEEYLKSLAYEVGKESFSLFLLLPTKYDLREYTKYQ